METSERTLPKKPKCENHPTAPVKRHVTAESSAHGKPHTVFQYICSECGAVLTTKRRR